MKRATLLVLATAFSGLAAVSYWTVGEATGDAPSAAVALDPNCAGAGTALDTGRAMTFGDQRLVLAAEDLPTARPAELVAAVTASPDGATMVTVTDAKGDDRLELSTDSGATWTTVARGENLRYPAVSPAGDRIAWSVDGRLTVASAADGWKPVTVAPVNGGKQLALFTRFLDERRLLLSVEVGITGVGDDFAALSDLWIHDLSTGTWDRLTAGEADTDRWSLANTPVMTTDGAVLYVRHTGLGSGTEADLRTELRQVTLDGTDKHLADLPDRWGIVAVDRDGSILWNAPDPRSQWQLVRTAGTDLNGGTVLGCGRASWAPPLNHDPDLTP